MGHTPLAVTYADVSVAAARIEGAARRTPVMISTTADRAAGARVFFKCENFQRAAAFKFRGAYNAIAALTEAERARGVVAYSSGNHAQAIALAGQLQRTPTTLVMPTDAPLMKVEATRGYGGEVVFYDRYTEDREAIGQRLAVERGLALIPSYDHPQVIAGQGTATKELIEEVGPLDRLFVCLGGGGLLAGAALAARELSPDCEVIGVEPEAGDDGRQSLRAGHVVHIPAPRSIADGAVVTHIGYLNFPILQALVHDIVTVSDAMLVGAMRFFAERMKLVVEPTGCLAAAAVLSGAYHKPGERVGVLVSGGNVDLERFAALISGAGAA
ncbi:MAG TPA: threo-3-hydroxy-L-aspartate ammonia-lyase [Caulobacteraceae bacterium]|nr:threo-3-hydroxy-L-aspartate ammonia-lyase [Caulobacteraceae bacterium]